MRAPRLGRATGRHRLGGERPVQLVGPEVGAAAAVPPAIDVAAGPLYLDPSIGGLGPAGGHVEVVSARAHE
jgi:hypothetical protein